MANIGEPPMWAAQTRGTKPAERSPVFADLSPNGKKISITFVYDRQ